jgi:hypothetical protein
MSIFINLKKASYFPNLPDGIYSTCFLGIDLLG